MKRMVFLLLVLCLLLTAGCSGNVSGIGQNDSGYSEEQLAMLEEAGLSVEAFLSESEELQQAILMELGIAAEEQGKRNESTSSEKKSYTTADVAAGGNYRVRIGDGLGWNSYILYYEDGKLVKVETSFRKNDEEEPEEECFEGDTLQDFQHIDKSLDEMIAFFDEKDYGYTTTVIPMD